MAAASELHPQAALTHAFNHPNAKVFAGDIRSLDPSVLQDAVIEATGQSEVDIVVGGPPCQGFSTAGKKSATDPRNTLFVEFVRMVEHFRPPFFLLENVPGFKSMHGGAAYAEASRLFRALDYELDDKLLFAAEFGAPQRRQRFMLVGRLPEARPFQWPSPTHYDPGEVSSLLDDVDRDSFVTVEEALSDLAFLEPGWEAHRYSTEPSSDYALERRAGSELLFNHLATRHRSKAMELFQRIPEGQTVAAIPKGERPSKMTMARMARWKISNAVLALPDDMIHYSHDRIPTVREMARLQTFDDDYVFLGKRTSGFLERRVDVPQYTQVGNAVPPLLGYALGKAIVSALDAPHQDLRDVETRRARHAWITGSSGFSGYGLSGEAQGNVDLLDVTGKALALPVAEGPAVTDAQSPQEWSRTANPANKRKSALAANLSELAQGA